MSNLEGFRELSEQLKALSAAAAGKALRSAVMSASLPALRAIQSATPERSGATLKKTYKGRRVAPGFAKRNMARKSFLSRDKSYASVLIGPKREAFYVQFLEFGTSTISKRPFMEPAFRANQSAMIERMRERLKVLIEKAASKK
jgi:HK97 gp10 family phage protein